MKKILLVMTMVLLSNTVMSRSFNEHGDELANQVRKARKDKNLILRSLMKLDAAVDKAVGCTGGLTSFCEQKEEHVYKLRNYIENKIYILGKVEPYSYMAGDYFEGIKFTVKKRDILMDLIEEIMELESDAKVFNREYKSIMSKFTAWKDEKSGWKAYPL